MIEKLNVDCLFLIFNEIREDSKSLYYCLLVNREWCRLVVPILWRKHSWYERSWYEHPWYKQKKSEKKLFNAILSYLPSSSKQILSNNNIKLPQTILSKPPLFNYIGFCKFLEGDIIVMIINSILKNKSDERSNILERELYKLFISQCKAIKELQWKTSQPLQSFPGASTCFSQLYSLYIDTSYVDSSTLYEMAQICKDLNTLIIDDCRDIPGLNFFIDAQRNLKRITLYPVYPDIDSCKELSKALARNCNTINDLELNSVATIPPSFLTSLINLKKISIFYDKYKDIGKGLTKFQQYLAISEFQNLQTLNVKGSLSCFKELAMLIEKTKGNISEVSIHTDKAAKSSEVLIKAITNYCPKIKELSTYLTSNDFIYVKSLLINCKYLKTIKFYCFGNDLVDDLLDILAEAKSLTDISIKNWECSVGALERFFESRREHALLYFEISQDIITEDRKRIIRVIKKYIKEKVVKKAVYY